MHHCKSACQFGPSILRAALRVLSCREAITTSSRHPTPRSSVPMILLHLTQGTRCATLGRPAASCLHHCAKPRSAKVATAACSMSIPHNCAAENINPSQAARGTTMEDACFSRLGFQWKGPNPGASLEGWQEGQYRAWWSWLQPLGCARAWPAGHGW